MNVRGLYLAAGVLWAILLGPLAFVLVFAASAGFAWLYLFGDNPWPASAEWLLLLPAIFAGVLTAAAVIWLSDGRGRQRAASAPAASASERRRAGTLALIPVVALVLIGAAFWLRARQYDDTVNAATAREAAFAELLGSKRKITSIDIANSTGIVNGTVRLSGTREGPYRFSWRVVPSTSEAPVLTHEATLQLARGQNDLPIAFSIDELQRQYRVIVLHGRGNALVDELFRLEVALDPVLNQREISQLPPGEQRRMETGNSALRSQGTAQLPVRFTILP
jgi:hypothetical protein